MAERVGIGRGQDRARIAVDDDRREGRAVAALIIVGGVTRVMMAVAPARLRAVDGDHGCHRQGEQPVNADPHQARGSQVFAKHEIPVQFLT